MRMVVLEYFTDDARAFVESSIVEQARREYGVENTPLTGFNPSAIW